MPCALRLRLRQCAMRLHSLSSKPFATAVGFSAMYSARSFDFQIAMCHRRSAVQQIKILFLEIRFPRLPFFGGKTPVGAFIGLLERICWRICSSSAFFMCLCDCCVLAFLCFWESVN
jgi:hypothetical protein